LLRDNRHFRGSVDFLCAELDRVGPAQAELCRDYFRRAVTLELSFFEAAYAERT
jgi:thiaminase (transcriptional activator TenA)